MSRMKKDQKRLKSKNDFINKPKKNEETEGNLYRKRWSEIAFLSSKHRRIINSKKSLWMIISFKKSVLFHNTQKKGDPCMSSDLWDVKQQQQIQDHIWQTNIKVWKWYFDICKKVINLLQLRSVFYCTFCQPFA